MPTHRDYPWEHDARRREQEQPARNAPSARPPMAYGHRPPRRRSAYRSAATTALLVAVIAGMLYVGFTVADDPHWYDGSPPSQASVATTQPTVKSTVRGRLERRVRAPQRTTWPVADLKSRITRPGVVEVWGSSSAPDGATVRVYVQRTQTSPRIRLDQGPVKRGHFLVRARIPRELQHGRIWLSAVAR